MGTIKIKKDGEWVKLPNYGIQEFPDAPSDNKVYGRKNAQWSEIAASNQTLDIVTLFPEDAGTLSDENYQKVVDAWENKVSLAQIFDSYIPMVIEKNEGVYNIAMNMTSSAALGIMVSTMSVTINTDKTYISNSSYVGLKNTDAGTKFFSDNGEYKEINISSGALPQETQTAILNAINSIKFDDPNKTSVTTEEYNSIYNLINGVLTDDSSYYVVAYDKLSPNDIPSTGLSLPILAAYMYLNNGDIAIVSVYTFHEMYYTTMGQPAVGQIVISINNDLTYSYINSYGVPVISDDLRIIKKMTQSAYDGLTSKDNNTLYIITE